MRAHIRRIATRGQSIFMSILEIFYNFLLFKKIIAICQNLLEWCTRHPAFHPGQQLTHSAPLAHFFHHFLHLGKLLE